MLNWPHLLHQLARHLTGNGNLLEAKKKHFDFTSIHDFSNFTQDETIELLSVLRICLIELDTHLSSKLNLPEVIKKLVEKEFLSKKVTINSDIIKQRADKIMGIAKRRFGASLTEAQITPYIRNIGVR